MMPPSQSPDVWVTRSHPGWQQALALAGVLVGALLIGGARTATGLETTTAVSAAILGGMILCTGGMVLVLGGQQVVTVDPARCTLTVTTTSRLGRRERVVRFAEVAEVRLGELGDTEGGSPSYHVDLLLKDGRTVGVFVGAFEGMFDRGTVEARRRRLASEIQRSAEARPRTLQ